MFAPMLAMGLTALATPFTMREALIEKEFRFRQMRLEARETALRAHAGLERAAARRRASRTLYFLPAVEAMLVSWTCPANCHGVTFFWELHLRHTKTNEADLQAIERSIQKTKQFLARHR
jgi:hypothetical protein